MRRHGGDLAVSGATNEYFVSGGGENEYLDTPRVFGSGAETIKYRSSFALSCSPRESPAPGEAFFPD